MTWARAFAMAFALCLRPAMWYRSPSGEVRDWKRTRGAGPVARLLDTFGRTDAVTFTCLGAPERG